LDKWEDNHQGKKYVCYSKKPEDAFEIWMKWGSFCLRIVSKTLCYKCVDLFSLLLV
jgi:hypothetical protein